MINNMTNEYMNNIISRMCGTHLKGSPRVAPPAALMKVTISEKKKKNHYQL